MSRDQQRRAERIALGLCVTCGHELESGRTTRRCWACTEREVERVRRRRRQGYCRVCTEPAARGRSMCERHLVYYRDRQARRGGTV